MPEKRRTIYTVCDKTRWRHTTQWIVTTTTTANFGIFVIFMQLVKFDKNPFHRVYSLYNKNTLNCMTGDFWNLPWNFYRCVADQFKYSGIATKFHVSIPNGSLAIYFGSLTFWLNDCGTHTHTHTRTVTESLK